MVRGRVVWLIGCGVGGGDHGSYEMQKIKDKIFAHPFGLKNMDCLGWYHDTNKNGGTPRLPQIHNFRTFRLSRDLKRYSHAAMSGLKF